MGVLTIVTALTASLAAVATLRLELAVPLPKDEHDAQGLVAVGLLGATLTAVFGTATLLILGDRVADMFNNPELYIWLCFVPTTAAAMASVLLLNQLAIRHRRYGNVGRRSLLASCGTVTTQLSAGAAGLHPGGLILGLATGQAVGVVSLLAGSGLRSSDARGARSWRALKSTLRQYRRFPLLLGPAGLLNVLGLQLPLLLVAYYYGSAVTGWLGLTQRVLTLPVMLIGQAVAQVYIGELSNELRGRGARVGELFTVASLRLLLVAGTGTIVLLAFGPQLFALAFGQDWAPSGDYARALALGLAAQMVGSPLSQTLVLLGRQLQQLTWDACRLLLTGGAIVWCASRDSPPLTTIWAYGCALGVSYIAGWALSRRAVRAYVATHVR